MHLRSLSAHNFKSLRNVTFRPEKFSVIIGANGAGKSNTADAFAFVADIFRSDLDVAVGHQGGVHNFWYRTARRSKGALSFSIEVSYQDPHELRQLYLPDHEQVQFEYSLTCRTITRAVASGVRVECEDITLSSASRGPILKVERRESKVRLYQDSEYFRQSPRSRTMVSERLQFLKRMELEQSELILTFAGLYVPALRRIRESIGSIRVFQLYPMESRQPGVMAAAPELGRHGGNLPAIVKYLQDKQPSVYARIFEVMQMIMPGLESIETDYTLDKRLGLFFREKGVSRPWYADEVSDGTIRTLSLLAAIADNRSPLIVLEEPENHVHPWVLRRIYEFCAELASTKQIILTTHSPLFLNKLSPNQVFIASRSSRATEIVPLLDIEDEAFLENVLLGDYWEGGGIPRALPPFERGADE